MALPVEYNLVTVYGKYIELDGDPVVGYLTFKPSPTIIKAMVSQAIIVPVTLQADLDENGEFSIDLPATDDPDINPGDWTYEVTEGFGPRRVYSISVHLADAPSVNIFQKAPIPEANGTFYLQGATGPAGPPVIVTTGQPSAAVGSAGAYAVDWPAGVVYHRVTTSWDTGTHLAAVDIATHAAVSSSVHGVVGAVVGTDNAQILTNKTLAAPTVTGTLAGAAGTFSGDVAVGGDLSVTGNLALTGDLAVDDITADVATLNSGTVTANPTVATSLVNKGYADALGVSTATAGSAVRRDGFANAAFNEVMVAGQTTAASAARKDYVDTAVAGAKTYADGITKTSAQISDATPSNTASTVVKRSSTGDISVSKLTSTGLVTNATANFSAQVATPGTPAANALEAWQATDGGLYLHTAAAPAARRLAAHWGSGTTFPTTGVLTADTYSHTGLKCLMQYNGVSWVQRETAYVADAAARTAISTTYASLLYTGFRVIQTDSAAAEWVWDAVANGWLPNKPNMVSGKIWRVGGFATNFFSDGVPAYIDFDAGRASGGMILGIAGTAGDMTVPMDGFYRLTGNGYWSGGAGLCMFWIQRVRGASDVAALGSGNHTKSGTQDLTIGASTTMPLLAGDRMYLRQVIIGSNGCKYWGIDESQLWLHIEWVSPLNGALPF